MPGMISWKPLTQKQMARIENWRRHRRLKEIASNPQLTETLLKKTWDRLQSVKETTDDQRQNH